MAKENQGAWRRARRWAEALSKPHVQRLTTAGVWTARGVVWRARVRGWSLRAQETLKRIEPALRIPFYATPQLEALLDPARMRRERPSREYTPPVASRARIIVNPASGSVTLGTLRDLRETAEWLTARGLPTELRLTHRPGHATDLAQEATDAGMDLVIAAGGDGTVNDVIQALAGHMTALGVLPVGTVNVWAREMGIGLTLAEARETLLRGTLRRVDLGRAGSRYFLMMAGIGFDAEVARRVERGMLRRVGLKLLDYIGAVAALSVTAEPAELRIQIGERRRRERALMTIIGNTRLYGGAMTFAQRAVADDGALDVVVIGSGGLAHRLGVLARAFLRMSSAGPRVRYLRAQAIRVESRRAEPVQVDGEVIGFLPMTFTIAPRALRVVLPTDAPSELFSAPAEPWRPR
ncbi:MAG TPA: diacylglycerol kinase family protein [Ktedonobacterales bacterium]